MKYSRNYGIRHKHFTENGFDGDAVLGYAKDNIVISVFEDDDRLDSFSARIDGEDWGWIKDTNQLTLLLEGEPRE